jgi:hypothetical protein
MDTKRVVPIVVAIALIAGFSAYAANKNQDTANPVVSPTASVSASPAATQSTLVSYKGEDGKTAMAVLKEKYTVETKTYSFGDSVESINGLKSDAGHYWAFYVNGVAAEVGADAYQSKSTDTIEWRYEEIK